MADLNSLNFIFQSQRGKAVTSKLSYSTVTGPHSAAAAGGGGFAFETCSQQVYQKMVFNCHVLEKQNYNKNVKKKGKLKVANGSRFVVSYFIMNTRNNSRMDTN